MISESLRHPDRRTIVPLLRIALREDAASADVTSRSLLPRQLRIRAAVIAKASGILAGGSIAVWTFQVVDPSLRCKLKTKEGERLKPGQVILTVEGRARSIFAAERVALNLLGHLSGIATLTRTFVDRVRGTRARILDTRKTLPGLRLLEKYAVRVGGGQNHRSSLADAILIKTNHLRALGRRYAVINLVRVIRHLRQKHSGRFIEVEVVDLGAYFFARMADPDAILFDNWTVRDLGKVVRLAKVRSPGRPAPLLEVSGGVTLANVKAIARTGIDRISIGRLTHSAAALDVALRVL